MKKGYLLGSVLLAMVLFGETIAFAHITPPVVLISERDAIVGMSGHSARFFVRDVRLTPSDRNRLQQQWDWQPEADTYRFYLGRNAAGQMEAAVIFLTEFTLHGPVRVAVGLNPDGTVRDAKVIELTEETFPWLKPLIDQNFTHMFVGQSRLHETVSLPHANRMTQFYGHIVESLIQRAAALFEVAVLQRGENS